MYQLFNLGLLIGTKLGFFWWCLLFISAAVIILFKPLRRALARRLKELVESTHLIFKRHLSLLHEVGGNQGFPVQLEIFEQNLSARFSSLILKLRNLLKVVR